jgi:hypothetical protein
MKGELALVHRPGHPSDRRGRAALRPSGVIDHGTLVAVDRPAALAATAAASKRLRLKVTTPVSTGLLEALPEVTMGFAMISRWT